MTAAKNPQCTRRGGRPISELRLLAQIYIAARGPCRLDELYQHLRAECVSSHLRHDLSHTLGNMCIAGELACNGFRSLRQWWTNDGRPAPAPAAPAPRKPRAPKAPRTASQAEFQEPIVPARAYDYMHAPVYVPGPGAALRAGALDYKRHASHGYPC